MADKKSNKMLNIKRKRLKSRLSANHPEKTISKTTQNIPSVLDETSHEDDFNENDVEEGRQENSLCQLTKKVLQYIKNKKKLNININELVKDLGVKKRRIYDITNVLQGIGYIEKKGKNEIIWIKNQILNKKSIKIKNNTIKIYNQVNELNKLMDQIKEEIVSISSNNAFKKYGYITFDDLINLSKIENLNLLIIKANKGTKVDIMDKKNTKKTCEEIFRQFQEGKVELKQKNYKKINLIKNENHIFFDSNEPKSIKVYRINKGELNEIIKDENKGMYFFINKEVNEPIKKESIIMNQNKEIEDDKQIKINNNDSNLKFSFISDNEKEVKINNINNDIIKSLNLQKNEKCSNDLENRVSPSKDVKKFSIYKFLEWNKDITYDKNKNDIKKKYCGISSLFQKHKNNF